MKSRKQPGWKDRFSLKIKKALGMNIFLCDSCKWNWRGACRNPERPNATWCSEYEKRGK
jgi:ribosomal protein L37AE/L43A